MEPITIVAKVAETAKKVAEVAKKIQRVYNVSKEMKNVAESEGKDQLQATLRVASSAKELPSKGKMELKGSGDMQNNVDLQSKSESKFAHDCHKPNVPELRDDCQNETSKDMLSVFDEGLPYRDVKLSKPEPFDESIPLGQKGSSIFVEEIPSDKGKLSKSKVLDESIPSKSNNSVLFDEQIPSQEDDSLKQDILDEYTRERSLGSSLDKFDIKADSIQNEEITQQGHTSSNGPSIIEWSSENSPIETLENQSKIHEQHTAEISEDPEQRKEGLSDEQKKEIKEKTGWSNAIVDSIGTMDEAQIYMDAGLHEDEINGKPALIQPKIDGKACNEPKWPDWSNKDLAEEGYPPRDETGTPYELHHIGQNPDSPLAELTYEQHHSNGNFKKLHSFDESSIDRQQFNKERKEYWEARSQTL